MILQFYLCSVHESISLLDESWAVGTLALADSVVGSALAGSRIPFDLAVGDSSLILVPAHILRHRGCHRIDHKRLQQSLPPECWVASAYS
ncbi:hypothetical protein V6N13_024754 [Hibiscus sabdariffa]